MYSQYGTGGMPLYPSQPLYTTFMPANISAPYGPGGAPLLPPPQQLTGALQPMPAQQYGAAAPPTSWALTKAEKKEYDRIFRSWDASGSGFISGQVALEIFGQSGLSKDDLARIWYVFTRIVDVILTLRPSGGLQMSMIEGS